MGRSIGGGLGTLTPSAQDIYEVSTEAKYNLGETLRTPHRTFIYGQAATTIAAGLLAASDQSVLGSDGLLADASCVALAAGVAAARQPAITAALAVGDTWVAITHASAQDNVLENSLADGFILLTDSGGVDQLYEVKWNSAFASSGAAADIIAIELKDPILTATTDASTGVQFCLVPGAELAQFATGTDDNPIGAPLLSVADNSFAWFQCWGYGMGVSGTDTAFAGAMLEAADTGLVRIHDSGGAVPAVGQGLANVTSAGDAVLVNWQILR